MHDFVQYIILPTVVVVVVVSVIAVVIATAADGTGLDWLYIIDNTYNYLPAITLSVAKGVCSGSLPSVKSAKHTTSIPSYSGVAGMLRLPILFIVTGTAPSN